MYRKNNFSNVLLVILVSIGTLNFYACKSSEGTKEKEAVSFKEFLANAEKDFKPSDFDKDAETVKREASGKSVDGANNPKGSEIVSDTIAGFRVQVLFTQEIEVANLLRDTLAMLLPAEYVYIVYDQPYYKVRIGNYSERMAANDMLKQLIAKGYTDAWVVPDKVITNLPPKPDAPPLEQKQN